VTWEGIGKDVYSSLKLFSTKTAIYGVCGGDCTGSTIAINWLLSGAPKDFRPTPPEYENTWDWTIIELSPEGIALYNENLEREVTMETMLAVGSGRKVALYCMRVLGMSPPEAVHEACKMDQWSDAPLFTANLKDTTPRRWAPAPKKKKRAA
jgi:hypothetical protein